MKIRLTAPVNVLRGETLEVEVMPDKSVKVTVSDPTTGIGVSTFVIAEITYPQE